MFHWRMLGQRRAGIAVLATRFAHLFNGRRRHQTLTATANQMLFPHRFQRLANQRPVRRIVITQQCLMQATLPVSLRHHHIFTLITNFTQRVLPV